MNRGVLIGGVAAALAAGLGLTLYVMRPARDAAPPPAAATEAAPAAPVERPAAPVATPDARAPRPRPRAAAPRAEAAPEPAAAPAAAAPESGTLRIEADVPGAQVFLDRQFIGTAPAVAEQVTPGSHQLNVAAEGFDSVVRSIEVEPGPRDITVKLREVRLEAGVDVVHKHGIGSCRGRLVATAQGLRYETANRDDQFAAALLDLDTFQVDYLEKNLRLKLRKGKQFNFTDPEGNADRLFVFHRDVEKARERLRRGDQPAAE